MSALEVIASVPAGNGMELSHAAAVGAWQKLPISKTGRYINGLAFKPTDWGREGLPIIRIQNLTDPDRPMNRTTRTVDPIYIVNSGDILVSWSATLDAFIWNREPALLNQHIFKVMPDLDVVSKKYLFFALRRAISEMIKTEHLHGSTMKHINRNPFLAHEILVPDLTMQDAIVAEIEKQFSRLDQAVASLQRVKVQLKRYKASVLKAAVEGRLVETEAERARHQGRGFETGAELAAPGSANAARGRKPGAALPYETGEQLLKRILDTRRSQWQGKGKYKEPAAPDTAGLPELPEGWVHATAEQLTDENRAITYGVIKLGEPADGGVPVLRSSDVRQLRIDLDNVKRISPEIAENYRRTFLKGGEVVMTVRGTLGGIAVVPPQCIGFNVSREVAMLALLDSRMAQLVAVFVASAPLENWLMRRAKGIAYTGINIETLKALPIPVPPIVEQHRIVAEADRRLSIVREVEVEVDANLKRAQTLRQAVLARAFAGASS